MSGVVVKVTENKLIVTKEDKKVRITVPYADYHYDATFASDAETLAGRETTKAVSPASLEAVKDVEGGFASKAYADGKVSQTITEDVEDKAPSEGAVFDALALKANAGDVTAALALKAPLDSPNFTGMPKAPTAATGTETTQLANTAFGTATGRVSVISSLEDATGGRETVMYSNGVPAVMCLVPPVTIKGLLRRFYADETAWTNSMFKSIENTLHPAFIRNGSAIKKLWVAKYLATANGSLAQSLPNLDPKASINFDQARAYCAARGTNWHLFNAYEWDAVSLIDFAMGVQPKGNTEYGRSHDATWLTGIRQDNVIPGTTSGTARTLTGSGGKPWVTQTGIMDMVGNVSEWTDLLKLIDGKVISPSDNYFDLAEASWPDTAIRVDSTVGTADGTGVTANGAPVISDEVTLYSGSPGSSVDSGNFCSAYFTSITKKAGYTAPAIAYLLGLLPITCDGAAYDSANLPKGYVYFRNFGERLFYRGGHWSGGTAAGLRCARASVSRAVTDYSIGFRPAFAEL